MWHSLLYVLGLLSLVAALPASSEPAIKLRQASGQRLIAYVQTFQTSENQPVRLLPLLTKQTGVTHVIFASLHINGPNNITLNEKPVNDSMFDQAWSDAKQLQVAGIKVMALLGGSAKGTYQRLGSDYDSFLSSYFLLRDTVIKPYALDGLDIDIEESVSVHTPLLLIKALKYDLGPHFITTMAPIADALISASEVNLSNFSYFDLDSWAVASNGSKLIDWFNVQFYSGFGDATSPVIYESVVGAGWDPNRIVMGVSDASGDASPYVNISMLQSTISAIKARNSSFGGAYGWEYFNAGADEGISDPTMWFKEVGSAVFG